MADMLHWSFFFFLILSHQFAWMGFATLVWGWNPHFSNDVLDGGRENTALEWGATASLFCVSRKAPWASVLLRFCSLQWWIINCRKHQPKCTVKMLKYIIFYFNQTNVVNYDSSPQVISYGGTTSLKYCFMMQLMVFFLFWCVLKG